MGKKKRKKGDGKLKGKKIVILLSANDVTKIIDVDHNENGEVVHDGGLPNTMVNLMAKKNQKKGSTKSKGKKSTLSSLVSVNDVGIDHESNVEVRLNRVFISQ